LEPGFFNGFPNNIAGAVVTRDSIKFSGSIEQANLYVATLTFVGDKQGEYVVEVTVMDNGNTGRYCPPGATFSLGQRSCPRTSKATFTITAYVNSSLIAGVATGVGGGVLALAALGALLGAKLLKAKETENWNEWDTDNFGDVALANPLFKQDTVQMNNQLYQQPTTTN